MISLSKQQTFPAISREIKRKMPEKEVLALMPRRLVEELRAFVFDKSDRMVKVAAVNPSDNILQHFLKSRFGDTVSLFAATEEDVVFILKNYAGNFTNNISKLATIEIKDTQNIVEIVDDIVNYALTKKASDIHIEALKGKTVIRFRVDGILHTMVSLPKKIHSALIARFKILANLKIDEYRQPQDGRIELEKIKGVSLRVSTMPTLYGEKVVLRILDDSHQHLSIEELGLSQEQKEIILRNIEKPFGMIVASGPTGSGKTTTLYGLLDLLDKENVNISTLEDPIEYALTGVNQIQINPRVNLNFASGLRALLRQDPDVVMVGEIRDSETAIMASDAALTGHLVLTTVHTNDAPSAFTRFLEMKVEDFTVVSTINMVVAQRLVRRVCDHCAQEEKLDKVILKKVIQRKDVTKKLKERGIGAQALSRRKFRIGKGCEKCLHSGYQNRIGLFELVEINKKIHDLILEHASAEVIKKAVQKAGFGDIISDGVDKVLAGITTFGEVLRTTKNLS